MNKATLYILLFLCIAVGSAIMVHHFMICGRVLDVDQVLHHEFFASVLFAFSLGIIVTVVTLGGRKSGG